VRGWEIWGQTFLRTCQSLLFPTIHRFFSTALCHHLPTAGCDHVCLGCCSRFSTANCGWKALVDEDSDLKPKGQGSGQSPTIVAGLFGDMQVPADWPEVVNQHRIPAVAYASSTLTARGSSVESLMTLTAAAGWRAFDGRPLVAVMMLMVSSAR